MQEVYSIDFLIHSGVEPNNHGFDLVSDRQLNTTLIGLTQKTSQTLIPPCPLRPLWFDFPLPVRKS
ncbi:MAG: hypothetical protein V7K88_17590 [Nostoc sp.]